MTDTNEGSKFCFAFYQSFGSTNIDTVYIGIYVGTMENSPVKYRIRSGITGVNREGTVRPGEIKRELYNAGQGAGNVDMLPRSSSIDVHNDLTGIIVETLNSSQKISVMGFNDATSPSTDGFTAVPIINVSAIIPDFKSKYSYTIFTTASDEDSFLTMVPCNDIPAGEVTLNSSIGVTIVPRTRYFSEFLTSSTAQSKAWSTYNTPIIFSSLDDATLSGVNVIADQPIGVMTGQVCGESPVSGVESCDHMIEQIPPSYTWGYNFFIAPFDGRKTGYLLRVVPRHENTDFTIFCTTGTEVSLNLTVSKFYRQQRLTRGSFDITSQSYCCIESNRPLAVMQFAKGHEADDAPGLGKIQNLGDPNMVWVPAVSQYLNRHLFSNAVNLHPVATQRFTHYGVYITVLEKCFNASAITINGTAIAPNHTQWSTISCDSSRVVCGRGITLRLPEASRGTHLIAHSNSSCSINVIVFGWGDQKGFAYPAGFGMNPVGGKRLFIHSQMQVLYDTRNILFYGTSDH